MILAEKNLKFMLSICTFSFSLYLPISPIFTAESGPKTRIMKSLLNQTPVFIKHFVLCWVGPVNLP